MACFRRGRVPSLPATWLPKPLALGWRSPLLLLRIRITQARSAFARHTTAKHAALRTRQADLARARFAQDRRMSGVPRGPSDEDPARGRWRSGEAVEQLGPD